MVVELLSLNKLPTTEGKGIFEDASETSLSKENLFLSDPFPNGSPFNFFKVKYAVTLEGHNYPLNPMAVFWSIFLPKNDESLPLDDVESLDLVKGFQFSRIYIYSKSKPTAGWLYKTDEGGTDLSQEPLAGDTSLNSRKEINTSEPSEEVGDLVKKTASLSHSSKRDIDASNTLKIDVGREDNHTSSSSRVPGENVETTIEDSQANSEANTTSSHESKRKRDDDK